jgi:hypothetical protein
VLRIRDVYLGSRIRFFSIPDPGSRGQKGTGSRIRKTANLFYVAFFYFQAANAIIYPMSWQHIFIPVLPVQLMDYLSAPMPFLIGVPEPIMGRVRHSELGEVVVLYADENRVVTPFPDLDSLPAEVVNNLKKSLKSPEQMQGDSVSRAFLQVR